MTRALIDTCEKQVTIIMAGIRVRNTPTCQLLIGGLDFSVVLKEAVSEVCAARGFPSAQARTETG